MSEGAKCGCQSCGCSGGGSKKEGRAEQIKMALGVALFVCGLLVDLQKAHEFVIFGLSYLLIGGDVLKRAFSNISDLKNLFDEFFLMSIATIGAFALGEYAEAVAVMLFYKIGESLQERAVENSKKSISKLLDIKPQFANLKRGSKLIKVAPQDVKIGDIIAIKSGERVPLDGVVIEGKSFLDMSSLSGESVPKAVEEGSEILSGSINTGGLLSVKVVHEFKDSTVSKIVKFVEQASERKAKSEQFITRFARIYTPIVVACAVLVAVLPPLLFEGANFGEWFYKALIFLVISCPCALVISIPLSFFAGLGGASRHGILVKGGNYLEALSRAHTVVFDKTGTLTKGKFVLSEVRTFGDFDEEKLMFYAAHIESVSSHPIAACIARSYKGEINSKLIAAHEEIFGFGLRAKIDGKDVLAGNDKLLQKNGLKPLCVNSVGSVVHIVIEGVYAGYIVVSDEIKEESFTLVENLKKLGVKTVAMLTGDAKAVADESAKKLAISDVYAELLPLDKVAQIERLKALIPQGKKLIFAGDGINDAPSLASADVGIAFGALGSDIAAEAADVVLMNDNPQNVAKAIQIAKKTTSVAKQNIIFALGAKILLLILGLMGLSGMWGAIFADVGVALIAVLNAIRAFRV